MSDLMSNLAQKSLYDTLILYIGKLEKQNDSIIICLEKISDSLSKIVKQQKDEIDSNFRSQ